MDEWRAQPQRPIGGSPREKDFVKWIEREMESDPEFKAGVEEMIRELEKASGQQTLDGE
jgi:hypothetical protein